MIVFIFMSSVYLVFVLKSSVVCLLMSLVTVILTPINSITYCFIFIFLSVQSFEQLFTFTFTFELPYWNSYDCTFPLQ